MNIVILFFQLHSILYENSTVNELSNVNYCNNVALAFASFIVNSTRKNLTTIVK